MIDKNEGAWSNPLLLYNPASTDELLEESNSYKEGANLETKIFCNLPASLLTICDIDGGGAGGGGAEMGGEGGETAIWSAAGISMLS